MDYDKLLNEIKRIHFIGIGGSGMCPIAEIMMSEGFEISGSDMNEVAGKLVGHMMKEEYGLLTLYYGSDVNEEDAEALSDTLSGKYPDIDIEIMPGGQPVYYYILSLE